MRDTRPRICVLVTPGMGGPHAWAVRLRERIAETHRVLIGCADGPGGLITDADFYFADDTSLAEWLAECAPAIVMPNWLWHAYAICDRLRRAGHQLEVVAYCRSDDAETYYTPLSRSKGSFDWIVAVSTACHEHLVDYMPDEADRVRLIRTFVDRPRVLNRSWQQDPIRLLYSGRLERLHKRVFDLVDIARGIMAAQFPFTLTIAGDGEAAEELQRQFACIDVNHHVRFVGVLPRESMMHAYSAADVLLSVSDTEGLSNAVLEGMAHGCVPVVTRTSRELEDLLTGPLGALGVDVGRTDEIIRIIERLATGPADLERLGRMARQATSDYAWDRYAIRFRRFLQDLCLG